MTCEPFHRRHGNQRDFRLAADEELEPHSRAPLADKHGNTIRTRNDARAYMLALEKSRPGLTERQHWQSASISCCSSESPFLSPALRRYGAAC
jgi:hypothetical protein